MPHVCQQMCWPKTGFRICDAVYMVRNTSSPALLANGAGEWSRRQAASVARPAVPVPARTEPAPLAKEASLPGLLHDLPPMPEGWKPGDPIPGVAAESPSASESPSSAADAPAAPPQPPPLLKSLNFVLNADFDPSQLEFGEGSSDEESGDEDDEESF